MSGYIGGSSIIRGGHFSSYDPAEGVRIPKAKKRSARIPSKTSNKTTPNTKKHKDPQEILEAARKNLLHRIIDQILAGLDEVKVSNSIHPKLQVSLIAAGSPIAWASNQKEFDVLEEKKRKKREKRLHKMQARQQQIPVTVEVKRKKRGASSQLGFSPKSTVTAEDAYQSKRTSLIRSLVDQMLEKRGALTASNLDSRLFEELKVATSPLLWLQAQPDYKGIFKARYLALREVNDTAQATVSKRSKRRKKGKKKKVKTDLVFTQDQSSQINQKKKRVKRRTDPDKKTTRPVKPLGDANVGFILKQIDKISKETLNARKTDWDLT